MEQLKLKEIIKEISPLYNFYRQSKRDINGTDALQILWEIGDIIKREVENSNIAPHNLYRKIYGKSEGKEDVTQKSYITRDFLSRSYRVRNIFESKTEIKKCLPSLKKFRLFYQAMPFIDNPKYSFKGKDRENLFNLLNSNKSYKEIISEIYVLQKKTIRVKNSRNQRLIELQPQKETFINFYNFLFNLIKNNSYDNLKKNSVSFDDSLIMKLSANTSALAQEGLRYSEIEEVILGDPWNSYLDLLKYFSEQVDAKERRRFRRLISPERIVRLAEMLQALISKDSFKSLKSKIKLP